jgi:hypothetical protein
MIKLLLAVLVVGLAAAFMLKDKESGEASGEIYKKELDAAKGLEQQMLEDANRQMEEADRLSQ